MLVWNHVISPHAMALKVLILWWWYIMWNYDKTHFIHSSLCTVYYGTYEMYTWNYKAYKHIEIALFPYVHAYSLVSMCTTFQAAVAFALTLQCLVFQWQVLVPEHCTGVSICSVLNEPWMCRLQRGLCMHGWDASNTSPCVRWLEWDCW